MTLAACNDPAPAGHQSRAEPDVSLPAAVSTSPADEATATTDNTGQGALSAAQDSNHQGGTAMLRSTYDQCLNNAGGVTPEIQDCIETEYEFQETRLDKVYKELLAKSGSDQKAALEIEQKKWLSDRDTQCAMDPNEGGQGQRLEANDCFLEMTAKRAAELEAR
jgi:uncharacterized protein YecT (DUF1311 family)